MPKPVNETTYDLDTLTIIQGWNKTGIPVEEGGSSHVCADSTNLFDMVTRTNSSNIAKYDIESKTDIYFRLFCDCGYRNHVTKAVILLTYILLSI